MDPAKVPKTLWKLLRKFKLARTPQEEKFRLFMSSRSVCMEENIFSINLVRLLKAAMLLDERLAGIKIQAVEGGDTDIDVLYLADVKKLLLHGKWLDFDRVHIDSSCELHHLSQQQGLEINEFYCDHTAEDLFELTVNEVKGVLNLTSVETTALRRDARERIRQTPRRLQVSKTSQRGELAVTWKGNESGTIAEHYGSVIQYDVALHKASSCKTRGEDLLHCSGMYIPFNVLSAKCGNWEVIEVDQHTPQRCECPLQVAPLSDCKTVFTGLDREEDYFPMVARTGAKTFFGVPPPPVKPRWYTVNLSVNRKTPTERVLNSVSGVNEPSWPRRTSALERPTTNGIPPDDTATNIGFWDDPFFDEDDGAVAGDDDDLLSEYQPLDDTSDDENIFNVAEVPQGRSQISRSESTDIEDISSWLQDEEMWQNWHREELPNVFSKLLRAPRIISECKV
jgi:hypothetical protein